MDNGALQAASIPPLFPRKCGPEVAAKKVGQWLKSQSRDRSMDLYRSMIGPKDCIVQELCESRGGRPGLSVLTSLLVSVDVKIY